MSLLSYCPIAENNNNAFKFQGALPKRGVQYVVRKITFYRTPINIYKVIQIFAYFNSFIYLCTQ